MTRLSVSVIIVLLLSALVVSAASQPPSTGTISPSAGTMFIGPAQQIVATFSDPDGFGDIADCRILLNTTLTSANGVFLRFNLAANRMYLRDDGNTSWLGDFAPGAANTIANSQCTVYCADTSVVRDGNTVTITVSVALKAKVAGKTLTEWLYVGDVGGAGDGWNQAGSIAAALPPPTNTSVSPNTGLAAASEMTFTTVQTDLSGGGDIKSSYLLINNTVSGTGAIYLWYDAALNQLWLRNDANSAWYGGVAPGSVNTTTTARADLLAAQTTVSVVGNTLTVNWRVLVKAPMQSRKCNLYMYAADTGNLNTGWQKKGEITFDQPPVNAGLDPAAPGALSAGGRLTLSSAFSDADGYRDIRNVYLVINSALSSKNAASLWYDAAANKLYLRNDANTAWLGGFAPGAVASLIENASCKLDCFETTVNGVGPNLVVNWRLEPKAAMSGKAVKAWMYVTDSAGVYDGWDEVAAYTVGAPDLVVTAVPTNSTLPTGKSFAITTAVRAPNGASATSCYLLLNSSQGPANGVYLYYDGPNNKMYMRNDAGTAWLGGFAPDPQSAETISNSLATLTLAKSRAAMFGDQLEVRWFLEFAPAAAGRTLRSWVYTTDTQGLTDGWDNMGTLRIVSPGTGAHNLGISPVAGLAPVNLQLALRSGHAYSDGVPTIKGCYLLMNSTLDGGHCPYFWYDVANNKLWIRNDANTAWVGGFAPGSANVIENSFVKLHCQWTTVNALPDLTIEWSIEFKSTLAGRRLKAWLYTIDNSNNTDGWDQFGDFVAETLSQAVINTSKGAITLSLYDDESPLTVANFKRLAKLGFFSGTDFHRVEDWVIQGGDGDPLGRLATSIPLEQNPYRTWVDVGQIGMARTSDPNSASSQFFINKQTADWLDPSRFEDGYALFGVVTDGMSIVNSILVGDLINSVLIP